MVDVKELSKLSPEELEKIQSVISLFHLMGLSDEDISILPEVLKNWPMLVKNLNLLMNDVVQMKGELVRVSGDKIIKGNDVDTSDNIRESIGFGSSVERVFFNKNEDGGLK